MYSLSLYKQDKQTKNFHIIKSPIYHVFENQVMFAIVSHVYFLKIFSYGVYRQFSVILFLIFLLYYCHWFRYLLVKKP